MTGNCLLAWDHILESVLDDIRLVHALIVGRAVCKGADALRLDRLLFALLAQPFGSGTNVRDCLFGIRVIERHVVGVLPKADEQTIGAA